MSASILPPIEEPASFSSVQAPDEVNSAAHYPVIGMYTAPLKDRKYGD
jgi:hypothetical protein